MAKHPLSFMELHNQFFMQGSNLGNKINAAQKGAKLLLDDERQVVWIYFKQKVSFVPLASVASCDAIEIPEDIKESLGLVSPLVEETPVGPPAIARARRGRPPKMEEVEPTQTQATPVTYPDFDPNDLEAVAHHRELVRAASSHANKASFKGPQNDRLIQETRAIAMGVKLHNTAQVQTAEQVGQGTGLTGKPKAINHQQLKAQVAQEMKE